MSTWSQISAEAPELSDRVTGAFDAHKHKVMATLRADGSPRVSGTELDFADGEVWIGSMPGAMKALDLQRDPRIAIHSAPLDVTMQIPDVKIAGRAIELTDEDEKAAWAAARPEAVPPGPFHLFRLDITEVVCTSVADNQMTVESWHDGRGVSRATR
jgi:hypothetical protein